jgi:hypothetical protein
MNNFTQYIGISTDILFLRHPMRTSFGLLFGIVLRIIIELLTIWVITLEVILLRISYWEFGLLGIFLAHLTTAKDYFVGKTNYLSEEEEKLFTMIRESKATELEKQRWYSKVIEKAIDRAEFRPELRAEQAEWERLLGISSISNPDA